MERIDLSFCGLIYCFVVSKRILERRKDFDYLNVLLFGISEKSLISTSLSLFQRKETLI